MGELVHQTENFHRLFPMLLLLSRHVQCSMAQKPFAFDEVARDHVDRPVRGVWRRIVPFADRVSAKVRLSHVSFSCRPRGCRCGVRVDENDFLAQKGVYPRVRAHTGDDAYPVFRVHTYTSVSTRIFRRSNAMRLKGRGI